MLKITLAVFVAFFLSLGVAHTAAAEQNAAGNSAKAFGESAPELSEEEIEHIEELRQEGKEEIQTIRKRQKQRSRELRTKRRPPRKRR